MSSYLKSPEWPYLKWETFEVQSQHLATGELSNTKKASPEVIYTRNGVGRDPGRIDSSNAATCLPITSKGSETEGALHEETTENADNISVDDFDISLCGQKSHGKALEDGVTKAELVFKDALYGLDKGREQENKDNCVIPHLVGVDMSILKSSSLSKLLEKFTSSTKVFEDKINIEISIEINKMMEKAIERLRQTNKIFERCRLIPAGSVAEGTKVGKADEFDFLLVLDTFSDQKKWELIIKKSLFRIIYKDEDSKLNDEQELFYIDDESGHTFLIPDIRKHLMEQFVTVFDDVLSSQQSWDRLKGSDKNLCISDIAATLHLVSCTYCIDVDVDICMCIPVAIDDINRTLSWSNDDDTQSLFNYLKSLYEVFPFEIFAIIGEDVVISPTTTTRITAPLLELARFKFFGESSTRVRTYRLAKCIVSNFLPKLTKIFGCKRCCHPLVRSYHLKNIIFFMMKIYKEDSYWEEEQVQVRVMEIFLILKHCITDKLDEVVNIATCCTPGTLRIDEVSTFNPFIHEDKTRPRKHDCYFTQDSHKPMFQLSFSPEHQDLLTTGHGISDDMIKEWFIHLNKDHWSSYELLPALCQLLFNLCKNINNQ